MRQHGRNLGVNFPTRTNTINFGLLGTHLTRIGFLKRMIKELQALIKTQPVFGSDIGIMSLRINPNGWNGHFAIEHLYPTGHLLCTGLFR